MTLPSSCTIDLLCNYAQGRFSGQVCRVTFLDDTGDTAVELESPGIGTRAILARLAVREGAPPDAIDLCGHLLLITQARAGNLAWTRCETAEPRALLRELLGRGWEPVEWNAATALGRVIDRKMRRGGVR